MIVWTCETRCSQSTWNLGSWSIGSFWNFKTIILRQLKIQEDITTGCLHIKKPGFMSLEDLSQIQFAKDFRVWSHKWPKVHEVPLDNIYSLRLPLTNR